MTLDARPLPTPNGQALRLPSQRLALAIAAEWDAQIDRIEPAAMPLMALASTAIDQIPKERKQTEKNILAYAATDTCRFVADAAREPEVRRRQDKYHEPILAWLRETHGAELTRGAPGALKGAADAARGPGRVDDSLRGPIKLPPRRAAGGDLREQVDRDRSRAPRSPHRRRGGRGRGARRGDGEYRAVRPRRPRRGRASRTTSTIWRASACSSRRRRSSRNLGYDAYPEEPQWAADNAIPACAKRRSAGVVLARTGVSEASPA